MKLSELILQMETNFDSTYKYVYNVNSNSDSDITQCINSITVANILIKIITDLHTVQEYCYNTELNITNDSDYCATLPGYCEYIDDEIKLLETQLNIYKELRETLKNVTID